MVDFLRHLQMGFLTLTGKLTANNLAAECFHVFQVCNGYSLPITIAVRKRIEIDGYGSWSIKAGDPSRATACVGITEHIDTWDSFEPCAGI